MGSRPVEIANVFSCRLDVIWRIGCAGPLVSGNSGRRLERLDRIERRDPFLAAFGIRLTQMKVNIVVESIAADGQSDRRDVETGCAIGIGMPERNTYQLFLFQFENNALEFVGDHKRRIDLSGKSWSPIGVDHGTGRLLAHDGDGLTRRDEPCSWEFLLNCIYAKEMVTVAVGRVDRRQVLAALHDPVDNFLVLIDRDRCIHQHRILLARDKRRRNGRPFHFVSSGRKIAGDHRNLGTDKNFPLQSVRHRVPAFLAVSTSEPRISGKFFSNAASRCSPRSSTALTRFWASGQPSAAPNEVKASSSRSDGGNETSLTRFFAAARARRSKEAIRRARASTKPSNSASGSDRFTYPYRSAVSPSKSLALRTISSARPRPTRWGRRSVPPPPGCRPTPSSGWPSLVFSRDAKRMSQARTNSLLTPRAQPRIFAMLTTGDFVSRTNVSIKMGRPEAPIAVMMFPSFPVRSKCAR